MRFPVALLLVTAACGSSDSTDDPSDLEFKTPRLESVTPGEVALGDTFRIFGGDFLDPELGSMRLVLDGRYTDDSGATNDYQGELPLRFENPSLAEAELDRLYFSPSGDRIGVFEGTAMVVSRLEAFDDPDSVGNERASDPVSVRIAVMPSIDITALRSTDRGDCAALSKATVGNANIALGLRVLGMPEATASAPTEVRISFLSPDLKVRYLVPDAAPVWPPPDWVATDNSVSAWAGNGNNTMTVRITQGNSLNLDPRAEAHSVTVSPAVSIGQYLRSDVLVQALVMGPPDENQSGPRYVPLGIEVRGNDGTVSRRVATMEVWNQWQISPYNGNASLKERYEAEQTYACFPGGDIGRDVSYTEGESMSRSRSLSQRFDMNIANSYGANFNLCPFCIVGGSVNAQQTFSQSFGIDVSESVSSETHRTLNLSAHILPTFFAAPYRQLERVEREVDVIYHNECGAGGVIGQTILTDWNFGFDIATGPACPPPTNLPPAQVF